MLRSNEKSLVSFEAALRQLRKGYLSVKIPLAKRQLIVSASFIERAPYAGATVEGSTLTPGPIVEEIAMRCM